MSWEIFPEHTIHLLEKCLTWRSRRQEVIAGNVANLDTPDYRRKELNFRQVLTNYIEGGPQVALISTHSSHVQGRPSELFGALQDNGEAVDLDQEMVQMSENQLSYQASVQMLIKKLDSLRTVIEGDRR